MVVFMLKKKSIVAALIFSLLSLPSHSQFYKWVDENGKVHYSDKKPATDAVKMNVDRSVIPKPKIIGSANPVYYDENIPARWVIMEHLKYAPQDNSERKKKIAHFYFGADCTTPTSIHWQQLSEQYPEAMPKNNRYFQQITNTFYDSGYQIAVVENHEIERQLESTQGHRLVAHIIDMNLESCVQKMKNSQRSQNLNDFNINSFRTAQNWIQINWMLYDHDTKELIYENGTEGVSKIIKDQSSAIPAAVRESLRSATKHLLSDEKFVALLQSPPSQKTRIQNPAPPPSQGNRSSLDTVTDRFSEKYKKRAEFVEILTIANYLRIAAMEYYVHDNKWATDISDINLQLSELYSEDQVRSIKLRSDGTIELDVSPSFGRNTTIWLIPSDSNRRISITWQCQTNVETGNNVGSCKSF